MNKKLSIGLLLLVVALVTMPGVSAQGHPGGTMPAPTDPSQITSAPVVINGGTYNGCITCHPVSTFCTGCHSYPAFTLSVVANPTSVTAGKSTPETLTVSGSNNIVSTKKTVDGATVTLAGPGVSITGTSISGGIFATSVAPTGAGTISATATKTNWNQGTATITVTAAPVVPVLTTITVTPSPASVVQGKTQAFTASPKDQSGNAIAATIVWSSSNTSVGTISASGVLTAVSAGTTTVTATSGSVKGTAAVTVTAAPVVPVLTTITVTPSPASVVQGKTQAFTASPKDQSGNAIAATIVWSNSNTSVGTISASGVLTAVSAGTTTVTATSGSVKGTAAVTVTVSAPVVPVLTTITVTPASATVVKGNTQAFTALPKDQLGNPIAATIVWSSSNTSVGTISASGVLTAVSAGTTTVTATSGSVKGTAAVTATAPITRKATVKFVVTDSKTHRPINEAKVSLGSKTKETDDHGIAKFTDVVLGTYKYKVSKEGYKTIAASIKVTGYSTTVYVKMLKTTTGDSKSHD